MHTQSCRSSGPACSAGVILVLAVLAGCGANSGTSRLSTPAPEGLTREERARLERILRATPTTAEAVAELARLVKDPALKAPIQQAAFQKLEQAGRLQEAAPASSAVAGASAAEPARSVAASAVAALLDAAEQAGEAPRERAIANNAAASLARIRTDASRLALVQIVSSAADYKRRIVVNILGHLGDGDDLPVVLLAEGAADSVLRTRAEHARLRIEGRQP